MISRRRFLLWGGGATITGLLGGAYVVSGCPLSEGQVCVGPCTAYLDLNHDQVCDRLGVQVQERVASDGAQANQAAGAVTVRCPYGIVNDPYPGACRRYVDANGNGICDLSEPAGGTVAEGAAVPEGEAAPDDGTPPQANQAAGAVTVRCPYGIVNDPYPGACRRYVDANGNGICDLSEPVGGTVAEGAPLSGDAHPPQAGEAGGSGQVQRRRGRGRGGQ